jgi:hypothetical protein
MKRDLEIWPYSVEEIRVCDYLQRILPDIGCGDDPIGFLIASHEALFEELKLVHAEQAEE